MMLVCLNYGDFGSKCPAFRDTLLCQVCGGVAIGSPPQNLLNKLYGNSSILQGRNHVCDGDILA